MMPPRPRAWGDLPGSALIRCSPEDFVVSEQLGFVPSGEGEHVFLRLQKRQLNSMELLERVSALSGVAPRDIGMSGLKDRNAITRQWFSVGLAGRAEPDWGQLESSADVQVLEVARHSRKLRRGVHKANRFSLVLREVQGERTALEDRLQLLRAEGVPNYFGEQRFGRGGSTLDQARRWMSGNRKISRTKRSLYLSALRSCLFNTLLAARVETADWNHVLSGDVCILQGTRSLFTCEHADEQSRERASLGDIHPGLPLWGRGLSSAGNDRQRQQAICLEQHADICEFLVAAGLDMSWRPARMLADDFCWQFCDDGNLQLDFALGAGSYATALLAELVQYKEGKREGGNSSE
ncbi:MAG: tRNA pseudouridine(13) synthase TruD [Halioglobus sp.]